MLFFASDHVAGTHGTSIHPAALAYPDAAQGSGGDTSFIIGKFEMCCRLPRVVSGAQAQIFVEAIGINDLARIHLAIGIPNSLELAKGLDKFRTVHLGKQFRTSLTITVLS